MAKKTAKTATAKKTTKKAAARPAAEAWSEDPPRVPAGVVGNFHKDLVQLLRPITELRPHPKNVKVHDEDDLPAIAAGLEEFGQQLPILALTDGTLVAGHGRWEAAQRLGWTHLAVLTFHDEERAAAFMVSDNQLGKLAKWDDKHLAEALQAAQAVGVSVEALGFTMDEVMAFVGKVIGDAVGDVGAGAAQGGGGTGQGAGDSLGGGPTGSGVVGDSQVRMVQLFLDTATHPVFMERVRALGVAYGTDNVTDTVMRALEDTFIAKGLDKVAGKDAA